MIVTEGTTIQQIIEAYPDSAEIFARFGLELKKCELDLDVCLMLRLEAHSDLMKELQAFIKSKSSC